MTKVQTCALASASGVIRPTVTQPDQGKIHRPMTELQEETAPSGIPWWLPPNSVSESFSLQRRTGQLVGNHQVYKICVRFCSFFEVCGQNTRPAAWGHQLCLPGFNTGSRSIVIARPKGVLQRHWWSSSLTEAPSEPVRQQKYSFGLSLGRLALCRADWQWRGDHYRK